MQTQFSEYQRRETSLQLTIELFTRQITQQRRTQRKNNHEPFNGEGSKSGKVAAVFCLAAWIQTRYIQNGIINNAKLLHIIISSKCELNIVQFYSYWSHKLGFVLKLGAILHKRMSFFQQF